MRSRFPKVTRVWASLLAACSLTVLAATDAQADGPAFALQGTFAGASQAFFGSSVAIDGDTAVVGADGDNGGKGAAYVYVRLGSTWSLQAQLAASDGASGDQFGYSVAVSGNLALVGAGNKASGRGYLYSFTRSGTSWTQQAEVTSADGAADDCFGCALALSGTTALVGAPQRLGGTGGAYVLSLSGTWQLQREFVGTSSGDAFGVSVALTPDAATAVVGAYGVSSQAGAAYVFTRAGTWTAAPSQVVLTAGGGQAGDHFGYSVGASSGTVLVGAYDQSAARGAAYVFTGSGTSFSQQAMLTASDGVSSSGTFSGDSFGSSVALSGGTAIIGALQKAGTAGKGPGAAYFFTNTGGSTWVQSEVVDPGPSQFFGGAVAISGTTALVGASSTVSSPGAAYVYSASTTAAPAFGAGRVWALALMLAGAGALVVGRSRTKGVLVT
jgi:hypothetical protein